MFEWGDFFLPRTRGKQKSNNESIIQLFPQKLHNSISKKGCIIQYQRREHRWVHNAKRKAGIYQDLKFTYNAFNN